MTVPAAWKWEKIVLLPETQLQAQITSINAAYIFTTGWDDESIVKELGILNDFVLIVRPKHYDSNQGTQIGGGNVTLLIESNFDVMVWVRYDVDQHTHSPQWFQAANVGACQYMSQVMKALNQYYPIDGVSSNAYFVEPMRMLNFDVMPRRLSPGWGKINSLWEAKWQQDQS